MKKKRWGILFILSCFIFFGSPLSGVAQDNGSLQIKQDIIANDKVGNAGIGDFPIRGQLFLENMNHKIQDLESQDIDIASLQTSIDFLATADQSKKSKRENTDFLFKDYRPNVIFSEAETETIETSWLVIIWGIFFIIMAIFGVFLGNWWAKRRKYQKI